MVRKVEIEKGADQVAVEAAIKGDALFLGEETLVLPVENIGAPEDEGYGVLLEWRGSAADTGHQMLLLEGRYSEVALTAAVMTSAVCVIPTCRTGA